MHWGLTFPVVRPSFALVLVCLSVDVTGSLVPLNSDCFARFSLQFAPPFFCPPVASPYSGPAQCASLLLCLCCSLSPCLSFGCLLVLPGGACVFVLSLAPRARCLCWFVLLAVLVWASVFPVLPALPCCASCLCPSCLPCPACSLFCALVQLTLLCAGASLGVSGCSCDGSVALLSCWECGFALLSLRHSVHGNKGFLPCVGCSPSTPCYWWRRGA